MELTKTKYKQTELGWIPEDWEVVNFKEIGEAIIGLTYSPSDVSGSGKLVHRSSNIQNNSLSYEDNVFVSCDVPNKLILQKGDILICVRNGSRDLIGKSAIIDGVSIGETFGAFMSVFRTISYSPLIYQYVISEIVQKQINASLGATINQITNKTLNEFKIPLPPTLTEQKAIATALSDVDALISSLEKLIAKKKAIKQGAMQELLTPPQKGGKRLPGFSGDWEEKNLGKSATLKARIGWQGLTTSEYLDSGNYGLVTGTDFKNGFIDWDNCVYVEKDRYDQDKNIQLKKDDVLVTKDGTIGKVALINELPLPTTLNSGVFVIRSINNSFDQKFFYYILMSKYFAEFLGKLTAGSTISHLYQKDFVHFNFFAPKSLEEQREIALILNDMDLEIEALEAKKTKYQGIKQGMMQELLTGKTRLV